MRKKRLEFKVYKFLWERVPKDALIGLIGFRCAGKGGGIQKILECRKKFST